MWKSLVVFSVIALVWADGPTRQGRGSSRAEWVQKNFAENPHRYASPDILEDATLSVPDLIAKYGYPSETHHVQTEDNYILELHRIPHGRDRNNDASVERPVVFIMHGLISSSADYVIMGPDRSLGYILADEGFDVWLGNARGNYYSRAHTRYNPDRSWSFWNFTWDHIGYYDLASIVDYILRVTGRPAIHYIGHSQGTTTFFVLNALRPEYNDRFKSVHLMAPVGYMDNFPSEDLAAFARYSTLLVNLGTFVGLGEVFAKDTVFTINDEDEVVCIEDNSLVNFCRWFIPAFSAQSLAQFPTEMLPVILGHTPAGSALKQFAHYGQIIDNKNFRRWGYTTPAQNLLAYGSFRVPVYNTNNIRANVTLIYSVADTLIAESDVLSMASSLPNGKAKRVALDKFTHFDFAWGTQAKELVYDDIIKDMWQFERTH